YQQNQSLLASNKPSIIEPFVCLRLWVFFWITIPIIPNKNLFVQLLNIILKTEKLHLKNLILIGITIRLKDHYNILYKSLPNYLSRLLMIKPPTKKSYYLFLAD